MPVLKFRLNRKNSSGTYDTIHYETSANIVIRADGSTTVETSLVNMDKFTSRSGSEFSYTCSCRC